ncbi:MAG: UTRA domain-containing protein [Pseudomonadota bacterium]
MVEPVKSAFRTVKETLKHKIVAGDWGPGDLIPNEVELAAAFGCARATVNRAVRELADEGYVERKRKAGTRVRTAPLRRAAFEIPVVGDEIAARGSVYRYEHLGQQTLSTPRWLKARMGLDHHGKMLHLTAVHYADANPYQFEARWINLAALPQAAEADFSLMGPTEWLIKTIPFSNVEMSFSATAADEELAHHLVCRLGDPLFLAERTTWWQAEPITYVRLAFQRGHKMTTRV